MASFHEDHRHLPDGPGRATRAYTALRLALALVFFWFGAIKIWPASPADDLVRQSVFFVPHRLFFPLLGFWEAVVGIGLLWERTRKPAVVLLFGQMLGTHLPLVVLPSQSWAAIPAVPTEIGMYVLKNWVLLSAGLVLLATTETGPSLPGPLARVERVALDAVDRYSHRLLRASLAVVFVWFGALTLFGYSEIAALVPAALGLGGSAPALQAYGALKVGVGLSLLSDRSAPLGVPLATVYLAVSLGPLVAFPGATFLVYPIAPSFAGVYFLKDLVLASGAVVVAAQARPASGP